MEKREEFLIGCNYWASNAGCFTFKNFDRETVKKDLAFLRSYGVNCIRIFPCWEDFQPLKRNPTPNTPFYAKQPFQMRVNEQSMLSQKYESGLSEEKLEEFKFILDCAKEEGFKVIVAFITGWMSGRYFIPDAFKGKDVISDPECVIWECAFIRDMIAQIKHYDNIIAWEPGNECNCLSYEATEYEFEHWFLTICNTIRLADPTRPVYSGLYNVSLQGKCNIRTQAKYFDVLTTHPYPPFVPYCNVEGVRQMRASLHPAAETFYDSAIAGKPCMVEEISTLGVTSLSDAFTPEFFERALTTSLSVGTNGFLWWCAFEQAHLDFAPYDTATLERNLGLAYPDYTPKPVLEALKKSTDMLKEIGVLPKPKTDAVAIIPAYSDHWKNAYGIFMLGVQSGRCIDMSYEEQELRDSDYYILPCVVGLNGISTITQNKLVEKVKAGAKLLITMNGGMIADFEAITGLLLAEKERRPIEKRFTVNGKKEKVSAPCRCELIANTAKVLLRDDNGDVLLSVNRLGKGEVYFLDIPLEEYYTGCYMPENTALYEFYKLFFAEKEKAFAVDSSRCMVNLHELENGKLAVTVNNYEESNVLSYVLQKGYAVERVLYATLTENELIMEGKFAYVELKKI